MPRRPRFSTGGYVFHVLNRAVGRQQIFRTDDDYSAFLAVLKEAGQRVLMRLLSYCMMPNHWHLLLWPQGDDDLSEYMRWLTVTHTQRWHAYHQTSGTGPVYQGRFKSFPVQEDDHLLTVGRYIERNPLRAHLVSVAEQWRWSSLWQIVNERADVTLAAWPVARPNDWLLWVNAPQSEAEVAAVRSSVRHSRPFGDSAWQLDTARRLGLMATLRTPGRPLGS
jgi:putative transposase